MGSIQYRDILWDLHAEDSSGLVSIRETHDEEQILQRKSRGGVNDGFAFWLPLEKLDAQEGRPDRWAKKRVKGSVAEHAGTLLWNSLPTELTSSLQEQIGDEHRPVRLKISGNADIINDLPWEWLCPPGERPLVLRNDVRVCRSVPVYLGTPAMSVDLPIKVMLVVTKPMNEKLLDVDREIDAVTGGMRSDQFQIHRWQEPTPNSFSRQVAEVQPHIMHYIGHGGISHGDGHLVLPTPDGRTLWISPSDISSTLPRSIRLICLSTCVTAPNFQLLGLLRLAFADLQVELPTMIANQYPPGVQGVSSFWSSFYEALVECGGDTNEAVHRARLRTAEQRDGYADWGSFALVLRNRTGRVFRIGTSRSAEQETMELKAQLTAQLANELSEKLRGLGTDTPARLMKQIDVETKKARGYSDKLGDF